MTDDILDQAWDLAAAAMDDMSGFVEAWDAINTQLVQSLIDIARREGYDEGYAAAQTAKQVPLDKLLNNARELALRGASNAIPGAWCSEWLARRADQIAEGKL